MLPVKKDIAQLGFYSTFEEQLSRKHSLFILANTIDWQKFDGAFHAVQVLRVVCARRKDCR